MDRVLDIISHWDKFGQFLLAVICFFFMTGIVVSFCKMVSVLVRGWPPEKPHQ